MKNRNNNQNNQMNNNQNGYYDENGNFIQGGYYDQDGNFIPGDYYTSNNDLTPAGYYDTNGFFIITGYYDQDGNYVEDNSYSSNNINNEQYNQGDNFVPFNNQSNNFQGNNNYSNVNQENTDEQNKETKKEKPKKKSSKLGFIVAFLLICVIAAGVYYFKFYKKDDKVVHLDQYKVELAAFGTNRQGKVNVDIVDIPEVKDADDNIKKFLKKPEIKYNPTENLENGSKVDVEITLNKEEAQKKGLKVSGTFKRTLTVTGLSEEKNEKKEEPKTTGTAYWNKNKGEKLYQFVKSWEKSLNQSYKEYTPDNRVNFYGLKLPGETETVGNVRLVLEGDRLVNMKWSPEGNYKDVYNIVAVFSDVGTSGKNHFFHLYYFTILNGEPIVLITEQNQGNDKGYLYFRRTANVDLQKGFENIVKSS